MDCNFRCIVPVATWWCQFALHVVFVVNEVFHGLRDFVVQDVFAQLDAGTVETAHEGSVDANELDIFLVLDWLNEYGAAVDFNHDHDVLVASLGPGGEFACLVGKDGLSGVVHLGVDITYFAALELIGV